MNLVVAQGYEWLPGQQLVQRMSAHNGLQLCMDADLACVEAWAQHNAPEYDYIFISRGHPGQTHLSTQNPGIAAGIIADLISNPAYSLVYETELISIFSHQP